MVVPAGASPGSLLDVAVPGDGDGGGGPGAAVGYRDLFGGVDYGALRCIELDRFTEVKVCGLGLGPAFGFRARLHRGRPVHKSSRGFRALIETFGQSTAPSSFYGVSFVFVVVVHL